MIGRSHRKGSSLRELNNAVFDAMDRKTGGVIRVGMGSSVYGFIGAWVPRGLVGWMMGVRKFKEERTSDESLASMPASSSMSSFEGRALTPESSEINGEAGLDGLDGSEYISVHGSGEKLGLP